MRELLFGGLLSTPAPSAQSVGIMVGQSYDGNNAPTLRNLKNKNKD